MSYTALAVLLGFFGIALLALGSHRLMGARYWAAAGNILGGFGLLAAGGLLYVLSLNLQTYTPFDSETAIAEISFNKIGTGSYRATLLHLPAGELQVFTLDGDDWQLEARVLEWQGWPNAFGFTRQFRLERIRGHNPTTGQENPTHIYMLSSNPGFDLWQWIAARPQKLAAVQAGFTRSAPASMVDNKRYRIAMTVTGLLIQPVDSASPKNP